MKRVQQQEVKGLNRKVHIKHDFAVPYYHDSNGRIEKAIKTIRDALRKTKGLFKCRLRKAISTYNDCYHRGIKTSPNAALLEGN